MQDLMNNIYPKRALSPAAAVTDNTVQVTQTLDLQGCNSATLLLLWGALADADVTAAVVLYEGDVSDMSDEAAVADKDLLGTEALAGVTFAEDDTVTKLGYIGSKRYIRAKITPANNSGNLFLAAVWVKGHLSIAPAANPPA